MGNECNGEQHSQNFQQQFENHDATEFRNIKAFSDDVPSKQFASLAKTHLKLNQLMQQSKNLQLSSNPIQVMQSWRGIPLPPYIINDIDIYYEGQWRKGFPNGYGKAFFSDSSYYEGTFVRGYPQGSDGLFIFPNGSYKRGNFHKGSMQGKGKFYFPAKKFQYEGFWVADKPHGKGKQTYRDGSTYDGEFKDGLKQCSFGTYRWSNGKVYKGGFKDGFMEGPGTLSMENGVGYFQGNFNRNLINGEIKIKTQLGQYEGPFVEGQMHGKGKFIWNDGRRYEGNFEAGLIHGEGVLYFPNGDVKKGLWKDGEEVENKS